MATPIYDPSKPWELVSKVDCPNCDVIKNSLEMMKIDYVVRHTFGSGEDEKEARAEALVQGNTKYFPVVYDSNGKAVGSKADVFRFLNSIDEDSS